MAFSLFTKALGPNTEDYRVVAILKTITLWFPCLDGLIQTLGYIARVLRKARAFLNSRNIPACLDQAIQTRKP
jgi:hypothetical protein